MPGHLRHLSSATAIAALTAILATTPTAGAQSSGARPVDNESAAAAETIDVMSFNLWHAGTSVNDGLAKQAKFIKSSGADLVGVQESDGTAARDIAKNLGWSFVQSPDAGLVSRYPILKKFTVGDGLAVGARVRVAPGQQAVVWSTHLGYTPYGPYDACFGKLSEDKLLKQERESGRPQQIKQVLKAMDDQVAESDPTPVFLTGDFNAPSHLDWVSETAKQHCGYDHGVAWPTSRAVERAGLTDSFRAAHPDPAKNPGITWSPIFPTFTGGYGYDDHTGEPEPQDRIDYVHYAGDLSIERSRRLVEGDPADYPDHENNAWASDHAAVLTSFGVK